MTAPNRLNVPCTELMLHDSLAPRPKEDPWRASCWHDLFNFVPDHALPAGPKMLCLGPYSPCGKGDAASNMSLFV